MSTNPNNAVGTNAAYGGRTSVKAFNDVLGLFTGRGILSGWATVPGAGMTVAVGGDGSTRDVAIAENNSGDRTTINNISENPVTVTIPAAPASNSRYDLVVAYVDNPPEGTSTVADNPDAAGMIVVSGTAAATPALPSDGDIRSAITVDGGSGATAYYVIISTILVASGTTDITGNMITAGVPAQIPASSIPAGSITSDKIDWTTQTIDLTSLAPAGSERIYATVRGKFVILGFANLRLGGTGDYTEVIQLPNNLWPDKEYCAGASALNSNYQPVASATITMSVTAPNAGQVRIRVNSSSAAIVRGQICYYRA